MRTLRTLTVADTTVLLVALTTAQLQGWTWVGDEWTGQAPVEGYEVGDTTGALLGVILPLGHLAARMHVEWYDPAAGDFFAAGETDAVTTQGVARVLEQRTRHLGPVPTGEGFTLDEPSYLPARLACYAGTCPDTCPACEADHLARAA